jgi:hypothetical protein
MLGRTLLALAIVTSTSARAQIATDRPDFVESSATVGAGRVQIETSVALARDGGLRSWSTPSLVRVGIGDRLELRAESDLLVHDRSGGASSSGLADLSLGAKWAAADDAGGGPGVAILVHADLPTGSQEWRGEGVRPSVRAVLEQELPNDFAVGLMPGVLANRGVGGHYAAGILGVVLGRSWTDRFRSFVELGLEQIARERDGGTMGSWNVGGALLLDDDTQLDAALAFGATSTSTPFALAFGFSRRFGPAVTR